MALIDIRLPKSIANALRLTTNSPGRQQNRVLKSLLKKARQTQFGERYRFSEILNSKIPHDDFRKIVPAFDYSTLYTEWWNQTLKGIPDVCWPGKIKYFALSSGTSESASKYIPITKELMKGNRIVMIKQLLSLRNYDNISWKSVGKGYLMLGGSTDLKKDRAILQETSAALPPKKHLSGFLLFTGQGKK